MWKFKKRYTHVTILTPQCLLCMSVSCVIVCMRGCIQESFAVWELTSVLPSLPTLKKKTTACPWDRWWGCLVWRSQEWLNRTGRFKSIVQAPLINIFLLRHSLLNFFHLLIQTKNSWTKDYISSFLEFLYALWGLQDGSVDKGACLQAWWPELNPLYPLGERRD